MWQMDTRRDNDNQAGREDWRGTRVSSVDSDALPGCAVVS